MKGLENLMTLMVLEQMIEDNPFLKGDIGAISANERIKAKFDAIIALSTENKLTKAQTLEHLHQKLQAAQKELNELSDKMQKVPDEVQKSTNKIPTPEEEASAKIMFTKIIETKSLLVTALNTMVSVCEKMSSNEFFCQDPSHVVINVCAEPFNMQGKHDFTTTLINNCLDGKGTYLMCKHLNSTTCKDEIKENSYIELDEGLDLAVGDACPTFTDSAKITMSGTTDEELPLIG